MRLPLLAVFTVLSISTFAQSWSSHYQKALSAYQQEDFETALVEAKIALPLAKGDRKNAAFTQQLLTASALALEKYDDGLTVIDAEIENFATLESKGNNHLEAMRKKAAFLMGKGQYEAAATAYESLLTTGASVWTETSYEFLTRKSALGEALMHAKKYTEARNVLSACLNGLRAIPDAGEDYLYTLFNAAYVDLMLEQHGDASAKLSQLIPILEANDLTDDLMYADAKEMLSRANLSQGSSADLLPADQLRQLFEKAFAKQEINYHEALALYRQCEEIITNHNLVSNTTYSVYLNHARVLYVVGDYSAARNLLAQVRQHAKPYAPNSVEQGHVAILEGDLALQAGELDRAQSQYRTGIQNLMAASPSVWVKQVRWVADQYIAAGGEARAIPIVEIALKHQTFTSLSAREQIILYQYFGRLHLESRQTEALIRFVKPLADRTTDAQVRQALLLIWAQAERDRSDLESARQRLAEAVVLNPAGMVTGELHFEAARIDQLKGDYRQAEINFHNALKEISRAPLAEVVTPLVFNSVAAFYIELGNYAAAEEFFLNLLAREDGAAFYNDVRQNLAALYQQTGRYSDAKSLLLRALREDALAGTQHPDYAIALQNLAAVYKQLGRLDSAQLLYEQALKIDEKHYGSNSLPFATKLTNLGTVYQEGGKFDEARSRFEQALKIRRNLLPVDHPDLAFSEFTLANLLYRTQKPKEAIPLFRSAADFYLRQIHQVFPALSDYERTAFYNRVSEIIDNYEMFLMENLDLDTSLTGALLSFRLQTKALLLNSSLKVRNQILHSGDPALVRDFQVWQHTKEQLAYFMMMPKAEREEHDALYRELVAQANDLEKALSLKSDAFTSAFLPELADWQRIKSALKPGEAAMEIARVKLADRDSVVYAAIVVKSSSTAPEAVVLPDGNFLEQKAFNRYINSIRYQLEDPHSYVNFWSRLQPMLGDVKQLYLSADGIYNKINCATLFDNASNQYVTDRMQLVLVSNLLDLTRPQRQGRKATEALLVGAPDYRLDARQSLAAMRGNGGQGNVFTDIFHAGFAPLPGTQAEVTEVGRRLKEKNWNAVVVTGREASEEMLKNVGSATLLHIATHGFFVAPKDEHAQEIFSRDLKDVENNSMLRSGLILAGAEKHLIDVMEGREPASADDGVLTAYEVMNLNLDNTELVVLSACETGVGDVKNGEGVYGLQRAFLLAGARNVIMSLWKVDDKATQELMSAFYSAWLEGKDKSTAFHDAQLQIRAKYGHPFFWGGFVLVGR